MCIIVVSVAIHRQLGRPLLHDSPHRGSTTFVLWWSFEAKDARRGSKLQDIARIQNDSPTAFSVIVFSRTELATCLGRQCLFVDACFVCGLKIAQPGCPRRSIEPQYGMSTRTGFVLQDNIDLIGGAAQYRRGPCMQGVLGDLDALFDFGQVPL